MTLHARLSVVSLALVPACFAPHDPVIVSDSDGSGNADSDSSGAPTSSTTNSTTTTPMTTDDVTSTGNDATDASTTTEADSSSGVPGAVCGNGEIEDDEVCDDGVNDGSYGGCATDCTELGPHCGDGVSNGEEACDDGDDESGDGCNIDCVVSGTVLWELEYDSAAHGADGAWGIAVDSSDNVIVVGTESTAGFARAWIRSLDSDGNTSWTQIYSSAAGNFAYYDVAVDPDDDILAGGSGPVTGQGTNALVRKYDSDGGTLVTESYLDDVLNQTLGGVAADGDGYFAEIGTDDNDIFLRRLDTNGNEMWTRIVNGVGTDGGIKVAIDGEGNILALGRISQPEGNRVWTRKYDSNGSTLWTRIAAEDGNQVAPRDIAVDSAGNVIVTAYFGTGGAYGTFVRKYDGSGDEQWTDDGTGAGIELFDVYAVTTDSADNVIVTGVGGDSNADIPMLKYDADGTVLWGQLLTDDAAYNVGHAVTVDNGDNILVAGFVTNDSGDIWVAKLAP